jgi:rhodanese-related sulfurtransferase
LKYHELENTPDEELCALARSGMAAAFLRQMGYDRAENIGGFELYTGPVEK